MIPFSIGGITHRTVSRTVWEFSNELKELDGRIGPSACYPGT